MAETETVKMAEAFSDVQNDVPDIRKLVEGIDDDLSCAECCETFEDLQNNLEEAEAAIKDLLKEVQESLRALKLAKGKGKG